MCPSVPSVSKPGKSGAGKRLPARVDPQRRRPGQDADAVVVPDRVPVAQALGVVPHPVRVDDVARRPPAVMPSIRPSTCAGTPATMRAGGVPSRSGQARRTRSWLPPMPPLVTMTACARDLEVADLVAVGGPAPLRGVGREDAARAPR